MKTKEELLRELSALKAYKNTITKTQSRYQTIEYYRVEAKVDQLQWILEEEK